jgi:hypothetical protein
MGSTHTTAPLGIISREIRRRGRHPYDAASSSLTVLVPQARSANTTTDCTGELRYHFGPHQRLLGLCAGCRDSIGQHV